MKKLLFSVTVIALTIICYSLSYSQTGKTLPNVLSFEFSFGDDNLPDEYLLARPSWRIAVNNDGDIYINDEKCVKVFDREGKAKTIIGGPGQGPGEFQSSGHSEISNSGLLTVVEFRQFSIFRNDNSFIKRVSTMSDPFYKTIAAELKTRMVIHERVIAISETNRIELVNGMKMPPKQPFPFMSNNYILYLRQDDSYQEICRFEKDDVLRKNGKGGIVKYKFGFHFEYLNDNIIVYYNNETSKAEENREFKYILNIYSAETESTEKLDHEYIPIEFVDSVFEEVGKTYNDRPDGGKEITESIVAELEKIKHYPPVYAMRSDGDLLFIFNYHHETNNLYHADIFDMKNSKYLRSALFSVVPALIKNGYGYFRTREENKFPRIEVYKIDPRVYER